MVQDFQRSDIISLSLGGPFEASSQQASRSVSGAVQDALDNGIFVVAAAGNAGPNNIDVSTPANVEGVISVGAYDRFLTPWSNSSIGSYLDPYNDWIESGQIRNPRYLPQAPIFSPQFPAKNLLPTHIQQVQAMQQSSSLRHWR